jgi:hypothetical protein
VNNSAGEIKLAKKTLNPFPSSGKHASPGYELLGSTVDVCVESFESGEALVRNEYSVADRYQQVSL